MYTYVYLGALKQSQGMSREREAISALDKVIRNSNAVMSLTGYSFFLCTSISRLSEYFHLSVGSSHPQ